MCKTITAKRRAPSVPKLSAADTRRVRTDAARSNLIGGLYQIMVELLNMDEPDGLERLGPLRDYAFSRLKTGPTYGSFLRHLADIADRSDLEWNGGHGVEDENGKPLTPEEAYPCLTRN